VTDKFSTQQIVASTSTLFQAILAAIHK